VLRLLGIVNEAEVASAAQGIQGLEALNDLMAAWERAGINLGYYEQNDLAADTPIPEFARAAARYYLAFALAPEYGVIVSQELYAAGEAFYSTLVRDAVIENMRESSLENLPRGAANW
jgi:hypothetical protein